MGPKVTDGLKDIVLIQGARLVDIHRVHRTVTKLLMDLKVDHHDVHVVLRLVEVVNLHHLRVRQGHRQTNLVRDLLDRHPVLVPARRLGDVHHLHRVLLLRPHVRRVLHHREPARAQNLPELEVLQNRRRDAARARVLRRKKNERGIREGGGRQSEAAEGGRDAGF